VVRRRRTTFFKETTESLEADVRGALDLVPEDAADLAALKRRLDERFPHGGAAACALDTLGHDRAAQGRPACRCGTSSDWRAARRRQRRSPSGSRSRGSWPIAPRAAAAKGFTVLKVKLGHGGDDALILSLIRERFTGTIRVDPNAAWTPSEAPARIERITPFDIEFVEQPTPTDDIDGLRYVRERSALPIVADEAAVRLPDVERLAGACHGST
jgi:hypothetical protein